MASYVVLEPPGRDRAEKAVLVRDGFHFLALLFPVFWLLFHRMWREALIAFAAIFLLALIGTLSGLGNLVGWVSVLAGLYVGLEGAALRIAYLERADWNQWGVVDAANYTEAEMRYMAEKEDELSLQTSSATLGPWSRPSPKAGHGSATGPALGLFGYPGAR